MENKIINIFTLDGKINLKQESLNALIEISPKIKKLVGESSSNLYVLDDCLNNELVSIVLNILSQKKLKNTPESLFFINETCDKFEIDVINLNITSDLLLSYLNQKYPKSNLNSPHVKIAKTKIIIDDINSAYYEKTTDKLILKIKINQYICVLQKNDTPSTYLLSDTDYYVIKHKYKTQLNVENFDVQFGETFSKALKYSPKYFDKIMTF
jgi:hypothetical protein